METYMRPRSFLDQVKNNLDYLPKGLVYVHGDKRPK